MWIGVHKNFLVSVLNIFTRKIDVEFAELE